MCFCKDTMKQVKNQIYLSFSEHEYFFITLLSLSEACFLLIGSRMFHWGYGP